MLRNLGTSLISKNFIILLNGYLNNHLTDPEFNGTLMDSYINRYFCRNIPH